MPLQDYIRGFSLRMEKIPGTNLVELQLSKNKVKQTVTIDRIEASLLTDFFLVPIAEYSPETGDKEAR